MTWSEGAKVREACVRHLRWAICWSTVVLLTGCRGDVSTSATAFDHSRDGEAALKRGNYKRAADCFTEAMRMDPQDVGSVLNRALAYRMIGDREKALAD